jgi:predicted nucleic acid-binding protein
VSNTGPLIALAKVDRLSVLKALFETVRIPHGVERELLAKVGPEAQRLGVALKHFIESVSPAAMSPDIEQATASLGQGEQQAVALACATGSLLLMDERSGRAAARRLGLKVTGSAGVLIRAKEAGLVPHVRPLLEEMRRNGYFLSDALLDVAASLAGEAP